MGVLHSAFGLVLHSNLPVAGLPVLQGSGPADLEIQLGNPPFPEKEQSDDSLFFESAYLSDAGEPVLRIWKSADGHFFRLAYYDGVQFWLEFSGGGIWATWPEPRSLEEVATYLVGPVLGFALRLRGVTCLHASAVAVKERAIAFVGPAGAGKSTTAATMGRGGCAVLADDIVLVTERQAKLCAMPAFPFISLWPESVDMLYGSPDSLPRFIPDWDKRRLSLREGEVEFQQEPLPLGIIYLFGPRTEASEPYLEEVSPQTALLGLVANTYATNLLDREMRAKEFEALGRLVAAVPVRRLFLPRDAGRPEQLFELVRRDCQELL